MRDRVVSILLILWLVPLFTVVAAGHNRGALRLPGSDDGRDAVNRPSCSLCAFMFGDTGEPDGSSPDTPPTPGGETPVPFDPSGGCAICKITGTILTPAPVGLYAPALHRLSWPCAQVAAVSPCVPVAPREIAGRAPPVA